MSFSLNKKVTTALQKSLANIGLRRGDMVFISRKKEIEEYNLWANKIAPLEPTAKLPLMAERGHRLISKNVLGDIMFLYSNFPLMDFALHPDTLLGHTEFHDFINKDMMFVQYAAFDSWHGSAMALQQNIGSTIEKRGAHFVYKMDELTEYGFSDEQSYIGAIVFCDKKLFFYHHPKPVRLSTDGKLAEMDMEFFHRIKPLSALSYRTPRTIDLITLIENSMTSTTEEL